MLNMDMNISSIKAQKKDDLMEDILSQVMALNVWFWIWIQWGVPVCWGF